MADNPAKDRKDALYFCDESSFLVNEEYMAVAGIGLPKQNLKFVTDKIKAIHKTPKREEVKWQNTKSYNLDIRKAYVDCLVELVKALRVHFHIRFAPFRQYDHAENGRRHKFETVSKMYYQLLLHRPVRYCGKDYRLFIRPDGGECTSRLKEFVPHLNADGQWKYGAKPDCIADVVCLNSKSEPMLQLLDVSLGALTSYRNGRHLNFETSQAKYELATHAFAAFGIKDITKNLDTGRWFSVWNAVPKKRGPLD